MVDLRILALNSALFCLRVRLCGKELPLFPFFSMIFSLDQSEKILYDMIGFTGDEARLWTAPQLL
jgi:hypothetical protein